LYELCPYLYEFVALSNSIVFLSFVSTHGERDQVTASVLQFAMYVCTIELFFHFPRMLGLVGKDFDLSNSFVFVSFVFAHGERDHVTASVFQSANYVPLNSFFFLPKNASLATI